MDDILVNMCINKNALALNGIDVRMPVLCMHNIQDPTIFLMLYVVRVSTAFDRVHRCLYCFCGRFCIYIFLWMMEWVCHSGILFFSSSFLINCGRKKVLLVHAVSYCCLMSTSTMFSWNSIRTGTGHAFDHMNTIIKVYDCVCVLSFFGFYVAIAFRGISDGGGVRLMMEWWAMGQEYFWRYRCRIVFILSTIVINVVPFLFPAHISFVTRKKKNTITDRPNRIHRCCLIDIIFTICFPFIDASVVLVCLCDERTTNCQYDTISFH